MDKAGFVERRFIDLSRQASFKGYPFFSDFLTIGEAQLLPTVKKELYTDYSLFGGYDDAERQMACFIPDSLSISHTDYPIALLHFSPRDKKFAKRLTHRDILGSLMGLGIERSLTGDILINEDDYYVFVKDTIRDLVLSELVKAGRNTLVGEELALGSVELKREVKAFTGTVSGNRLDAIISCMTGESRGRSQELIKSGMVQINGLELTNPVRKLEPGDLISVRGIGKYRFSEACGVTKKDRLKISYEKFV